VLGIGTEKEWQYKGCFSVWDGKDCEEEGEAEDKVYHRAKHVSLSPAWASHWQGRQQH